jgi:hypothetical protein
VCLLYFKYGNLLSLILLVTAIDIIVEVSITNIYEMLENLVLVTLLIMFNVVIYVQHQICYMV